MKVIVSLRYVSLLLALWVLIACTPKKAQLVHLTGKTMGTTYNVKYVPDVQIESQAIQSEIEKNLFRINKLMSTYDAQSELSRFNRWDSTEEFPLSSENIHVIEEAMRIGELSEGYLDITVGPLVNLWGFGPNASRESVPSPVDIDNAKQNIGQMYLTLSETGISKLNSEVYVDLSTVAKGYAVDQLAELLVAKGLHNYLVEVGGEMRVSGTKKEGEWQIAVEKPVTFERAVQSILAIGNNAIATSGDYRNYFEENGVRYSHLIDPNTGYPISHNLVAVTVVHASSMTADALATAINVMGQEKGYALAMEHGLAVLLITRENDEFREYTTPQFEHFIKH